MPQFRHIVRVFHKGLDNLTPSALRMQKEILGETDERRRIGDEAFRNGSRSDGEIGVCE